MKFCLKTFEKPSKLVHYCTSLYLNARFSNYFVQILIIRSKCQGDKDGPGGRKTFQGGSCPHTSRAYGFHLQIGGYHSYQNCKQLKSHIQRRTTLFLPFRRHQELSEECGLIPCPRLKKC